jgi:hypothetical protein
MKQQFIIFLIVCLLYMASIPNQGSSQSCNSKQCEPTYEKGHGDKESTQCGLIASGTEIEKRVYWNIYWKNSKGETKNSMYQHEVIGKGECSLGVSSPGETQCWPLFYTPQTYSIETGEKGSWEERVIDQEYEVENGYAGRCIWKRDWIDGPYIKSCY